MDITYSLMAKKIIITTKLVRNSNKTRTKPGSNPDQTQTKPGPNPDQTQTKLLIAIAIFNTRGFGLFLGLFSETSDYSKCHIVIAFICEIALHAVFVFSQLNYDFLTYILSDDV